jgi:hypothetical protein
MAEWLKAHAWKACIPQGIQGSNPCLSAITLLKTTPEHLHLIHPRAGNMGTETAVGADHGTLNVWTKVVPEPVCTSL